MKSARHCYPPPIVRPVLAAALVLMGAVSGDALGAVVVANRSKATVRFNVVGENGPLQKYSVAAADLVSLATPGDVTVEFAVGKEPHRKTLQRDSAWFFHDSQGPLRLDEIEVPAAAEDNDQPEAAGANVAGDANTYEVELLTIGVKLLVDEEERAARPRWEERLRGRLKAASAVFERYARVRFETVAVDVWKSNNELSELDESLKDFETVVDAAPGKLAIGFSSQYEIPEGRVTLGGTHGPLRSHILLREWSQHVSEAERMEMLVHELGHYLGAAHSPELDSVMRPMLGDKQAVSRQFRVRLDPLNTLAVCLVADELRARPLHSLSELAATKRRQLAAIYKLLDQVLPDDPAAGELLALVEPKLVARAPLAPMPRPVAELAPNPNRESLPASPLTQRNRTTDVSDRQRLVAATREVLRAIVSAAEANHHLPAGRQAGHEDLYERSGDRLTEFYVSVAADAASTQPTFFQNQSFLLALAIAVDTDHWLRDLPVVGDFLREIEPEVERAHRLELIGTPTLRDRQDLAQHFFVSAAITSLAGGKGAELAGLAKEQRDADGGSGFSFCDWTADLAGIALAEKLAAGERSLVGLAHHFHVADYVPSVGQLPEGLPRRAFQEQFGSTTDERFKKVDQEVRNRIADLPAYRRP